MVLHNYIDDDTCQCRSFETLSYSIDTYTSFHVNCILMFNFNIPLLKIFTFL